MAEEQSPQRLTCSVLSLALVLKLDNSMFSTLIGNEEAKITLRRLLTSGRMPGSLLFTGEEGIGKKLFALELAKALNCRNRVGVEACDRMFFV